MSKKDFIALADAIRQFQSDYIADYGEADTRQSALIEHVLISYRHALADFCKSQNSQFNRERWLSYIAGECGPNGGKVKSQTA